MTNKHNSLKSLMGFPSFSGTLTKRECRKWEFMSSHESDIDWDEIVESVTRKNPLAFVTIGIDKEYVLIHSSLMVKSANAAVEIEFPLPEDWKVTVHGPKMGVMMTENNLQRSVWVDWAREVKHARWNPTGKRKARVKVVLAKV